MITHACGVQSAIVKDKDGDGVAWHSLFFVAMEAEAFNWDLGATDDDALLFEALRFIGDLEVDDIEELSPLSVDAGNNTFNQSQEMGSSSNEFIGWLFAEPLTVEKKEPVSASMMEVESPIPSWSTMKPPLSPAKPKGNPARTKRRQELLYLRSLVGDLENQLKELKHKAEVQQQLVQLEKPHDEQAQSSAIVLAAWEQVATRQYEQRQRSEMENIKLKRMLEDQIQVGKSLERLLSRKRPKLEGMDPGNRPEKRFRSSNMSTPWDTQEIFQKLLERIASQYMETSQILTKVQRRIGDKSSGRFVELVRDESLGMVLQTTESRLLPFEYELSVQEYWSSIPEILNNLTSGSQAGQHDVNVSDDIAKSKFRARATFGRTSGDLTVLMVDRRFTEAYRTVFIAAAFIDPTEIAEINMDGVYMWSKGWVVFEPVLPEDRTCMSPTKALTKMTSYMVAIPEVFDGLADQTHKVGALTNFIMSAISIESESRQQAFENRLFDRSCALIPQQK